ncbi:GNAT family N-acetyltransferase [Paraferrimonas sp. SM1919]|uniref:GNAT family N-acetyltransferase n=1 Tax=Paraferrimonas sp. SM1919 TaxID=2662263 RepID=UPI0013D11916|nr:GNAT family N-acetyltransferase [Paraferrimonas sp. SM1919]
MTLKITPFSQDMAAELLALMHSSDTIDHHNSYTLWQAAQFDGDLFLTAQLNGQMVGYIFGRQTSNGVLLWQICVAKSQQNKGIGMSLATAFCKAAQVKGIEQIQLTITPDNQASKSLFTQLADHLGWNFEQQGVTGTFANTMKNEDIYIITVLD